MKIRIVSPIVGDWLVNESIEEANQFKAPDTDIDAVGLDKGPTSIESIYDGMLGLGRTLKEVLAKQGKQVPIVEPTAAAIGFLESMIRSGISHSKLTYPLPREKERVF